LVPRRSVLIVDSSEETREVLRVALERRGLTTFSASRADQGLALVREHKPDCIVLDVEIERESSGLSPEVVAGGFAEESGPNASSFVLLGSAQLAHARRRSRLPAGQFVSKPYHYAPLIRKIEALLADAQQPVAARV
jgi:DNA-binding NtrC family response regulator